MTDKNLDITLQNRKLFRRLLKDTPKEFLFTIPDGFRNNIWWNIAHVLATQQILVYRWSGLASRIDEDWIDSYKKGTMPAQEAGTENVDWLADVLITSIDEIREDYHRGLFLDYQEYTTSTKTTLSTVEDAIAFNIFHEGYHLGAVVSLQKVLGIFPYR